MDSPRTLQPNEERHERFKDGRGRWLYQYDYRSSDGKLFSTVKKTYAECVAARDEWLGRKI